MIDTLDLPIGTPCRHDYERTSKAIASIVECLSLYVISTIPDPIVGDINT